MFSNPGVTYKQKHTFTQTHTQSCSFAFKHQHVLVIMSYHYTTTTVLQPFFRDHPGEQMPEENFWTLWCKGRLTQAGTPTIRLGATPSGLTSAHIHHPPIFFTGQMPLLPPTNNVKALNVLPLMDSKIFTLLYRQIPCVGSTQFTISWPRRSVKSVIFREKCELLLNSMTKLFPSTSTTHLHL